MADAIADKVAYIKGQGQTRDHHCHWPGCHAQVPPAMWGCTAHWYKLPKPLRDRIWRTYKPGQEVKGTPSSEYIAAAQAAQAWIAQQEPKREDPQQALLGAAPAMPTPHSNIVTLVDGRQADSASEDWRHECEARHVAKLPTQQARQDYLAKVREKRGAAPGQQLEALAMQIYRTEVRGTKT